MKKRLSIKNIIPVLVVIAALFASNLAVAYDHHDLDNLPLDECPICDVSHVLSSADSFAHIPNVNPSPCVIVLLLPSEYKEPHHSVHLTNLNYRAPPQ